MATVRKQENSPYWTAIYKDDQNKWIHKTTKLTKRNKALELAIEWERVSTLARERILTESICREVIGGILKRTTGEELRQASLKEFCDEWIKGKQNAGQEATATRYQGSVERFRDFLKDKANRPVAAVTAHDCQKYYDHISGLRFAKSTLVVEMKTIIGLFNQARRIGLISINPAAAIALPKRVKQVKRDVFTPAQIGMLLKEAEPEWKTAILLGYYAGMRLGDAVTLEWGSVDLTGDKLKYKAHKTDQELEIPMHPTLSAHLSEIAGDSSGPICPTLSSVPIGGRSGLSKQFLAIMKKAGIANDAVETGGQRMLSRLSFHALRVTFNSELHKQGTDQELRMKLTGHKSKSINDTYTRTTQDMLREEIKKLPSLKV